MTWLALLKYGIVAAAVAGVVWWIGSGDYAKGYSKGKLDGEIAASEAVNRLRDSMEARLVADIRAEQATKLAELQKAATERELKYASEALANQLRTHEAIANAGADRDALLDELRRTRADRQVRARGSCPGVPQAAGSAATGAVPSGLLSERDEADLVRRSGDAERINHLYGQCKGELDRLRNRASIEVPSVPTTRSEP